MILQSGILEFLLESITFNTFIQYDKKPKLPSWGGGGSKGGFGPNFQLLMLSPNLLKSQSPITVGEGRGGGLDPTSNFDAKSKPSKISKSPLQWEGEGKGW